MLFIEKALCRRNDTLGALHALAEIPTATPQVTATSPSGRRKQSRGIMRKVRNVALLVSFSVALACVSLAYGALKASEAAQGVGVGIESIQLYPRGNFNRERGR